MKKLSLALLLILVGCQLKAQQQILLLTENFESGNNTFELDSPGIGTNTGNNRWIINNEYNGAPVYVNTPPQDSIVSGTITNAPNSTYLHIHDATATGSGIANANWNTNNASDRFARLKNTFCTLGMTDVTLTFFWLCEGNADAYGEVYYRIDGGPWTKTGQAKYNNQNKWKYEVIQDPAFENVQNLQIGFRWVNQNTGTSNLSFAIDDIIAVGTYDNVNNPVNITITSVQPQQVCQDNFLVLNYQLSAPLCDGTYQIQMSDKNGNFSNPFNGGVFTIFAPDTAGAIGFQVPADSAGTCFRIRLVRLNPQPLLTSTASACFEIIDCPEQIFTTDAPVMNDPDTTCILSVIDVKFISFGVFGNNNRYIAELSDSTGSFATPFKLGELPSRDAFPGPPGNVSGLIPQNVPPGCGYFIRVRSTNPATIGSVIGPFCLVRCDELTNNHEDLKFCIPAKENPLCDTFRIQPNYWNNQANYDTCNKWTIELRSMINFSLVNSGGLGVYHDSIGGFFGLCMPPVRELLPVPPGAYYMRIVSNCSNQAWNQTGSVIRITIGAPDTIAPTITFDDTASCNVGIVSLFVNPFKSPPSDYEWSSPALNNGFPFIWEFNPLLVDFTGAPLGDYTFFVREINFGCSGPASQAGELTIIGVPDVDIQGPEKVCLGDTVNFFVGYLEETFYNWDAPSSVKILDEANSQVTIIFDSLGEFTFSNFSLNECGSDSDFYTVKVITPYTVNAGPDKAVCAGDELQINGSSNDLDRQLLTTDTSVAGRQGGMFNIIAAEDVVIDSIAVKVLSTQPTQAEIYTKPGSYRTFEQLPGFWNLKGAYFNFPPAPAGDLTVVPVTINQPIAKGDTVAFYVTTVNTSPTVNLGIANGFAGQETVYKTDGIISITHGIGIDYPFGPGISGGLIGRMLNCEVYYSTRAGIKYLWNTGDTTLNITLAPQQSNLYTVMMYDTSGCKTYDSLFVTVNALPTVNAGPDTVLCDGEAYTLQASASVSNVLWNPATGLSSATVLNPSFSASESIDYILIVNDTTGCKASDSVRISVKNCAAYIEVPQAFTPNGDGVNDHFTIFGNNISEFNISIYNRWGELVYSSNNVGELNDLSQGWDGTHRGNVQNVGTFVYQLTAKDIYGKSYEKKGNLTLIR